MTLDPPEICKRNLAHKCILPLTLMVVTSLLPIASGAAQQSASAAKHPKSNASRTFKARQSCGSGINVLLTSATAVQGALVLLEVHGAHGLSQVKGDWHGKPIPFWKEGAGPGVQRALLGVDLETPPAVDDLKISGESANGEPFTCSVNVTVTAGKFRTEHLTVKKKFAEPNPEQLKEAQADIKRLREIFATVTPEKLWHGRFRIPLNGVKTGGNFGRRRVLNGIPGSPHTGVDMHASLGTPVYAAQSGRVVLADNLYFSGNTVVLDHGYGIYTLYGHFESMAVREGETVKEGQRLGKAGATGRVTGPHLHWGLVVAGARVNALQIVRVLPD
jgi:Peptidase family M23